jgi:hypothetical protein
MKIAKTSISCPFNFHACNPHNVIFLMLLTCLFHVYYNICLIFFHQPFSTIGFVLFTVLNFRSCWALLVSQLHNPLVKSHSSSNTAVKYIEITSWKVRAYGFYLRFLKYNKTNERVYHSSRTTSKYGLPGSKCEVMRNFIGRIVFFTRENSIRAIWLPLFHLIYL